MLLPSALGCDGGRVIPSSPSTVLSPAPRRASRIPLERSSLAISLFTASSAREGRFDSAIASSIGTTAVEGIFTTCKKLHQILSLDTTNRSASQPASAAVSATTQTHNAFNLAISASSPVAHPPSTPPPRRNHASQAVSTTRNASSCLAVPSTSAIPKTPSPKKCNGVRLPKTPMRRNKRRWQDDEDDGFYYIPTQTQKRPRLTIVPPTAIRQTLTTTTSRSTQNQRFNRRCRQLRMATSTPEKVEPPNSTSLTPSALQLSIMHSSPQQEQEAEDISQMQVATVDENEDARDWSHAEDRLLVEMVLQKLRLSARDWADCARSLGRDPRTVGNRWDMIVNTLTGVREGRVGEKKRRRIEDGESSSTSKRR